MGVQEAALAAPLGLTGAQDHRFAADLSHADLRRATLSGSDLTGAPLAGADLS
jgi:uncharacterized protein YjbI with pentapeptide repeats